MVKTTLVFETENTIKKERKKERTTVKLLRADNLLNIQYIIIIFRPVLDAINEKKEASKVRIYY